MLNCQNHLSPRLSQVGVYPEVRLPTLLVRAPQQKPQMFKEGQSFEYLSKSSGGWIPCTIVRLFHNGDIEIDVKRGHRFSANEACKLLRSIHPGRCVHSADPSHASISKSKCEDAGRPAKKHRSMSKSELHAALHNPQSASESSADFSVEELQVTSSHDPTHDPALKTQITAKLGLSKNSAFRKLPGFCGGQNGGVWVIEDIQNTLILKLVQSRGVFGLPSEAQKLKQLYDKHPSVTSDVSVAFPFKIFNCVGPSSEHLHDFIVMRKVAGESLCDIMNEKYRHGTLPEILPILRELGTFLAGFHKRYDSSQHGDFHASNIFYDSSSGSFAVIDVADLGNRRLQKSDTAYFTETLSSMSIMRDLFSESKRNFEEGYEMGK